MRQPDAGDQRSRGDGGDDGGHHGPGALPAGDGGEVQQRRPDQIELLLDRERPVVLIRRGSRVRRQVVGALRGESEVGNEERGGHRVARGSGDLQGRKDQIRHQQGDEQRQDRGRQDPPGATCVELPERDLSRALDVAGDEPGDEKAGDHEEHVNADEPSAQARHTCVVGHDGDDRDRAQALDVGTETPGCWRITARRRRPGGQGIPAAATRSRRRLDRQLGRQLPDSGLVVRHAIRFACSRRQARERHINRSTRVAVSAEAALPGDGRRPRRSGQLIHETTQETRQARLIEVEGGETSGAAPDADDKDAIRGAP